MPRRLSTEPDGDFFGKPKPSPSQNADGMALASLACVIKIMTGK